MSLLLPRDLVDKLEKALLRFEHNAGPESLQNFGKAWPLSHDEH